MAACEDSENERQQLIPSAGIDKKESERIFSRKRHWKNLIVLSLTLLFCITGFGGIQNIQSSINSTEALGFLSLSVIYATLIISNFLNPSIIKFLKPKWAIIISAVCYCIYTFANLYPSCAILLSSSCIVGLFGSTIWVSTGTYLTTSALQYAEGSGEEIEHVVCRFNGIMYALYQTNQIWGNLISYFVLKRSDSETKLLNVSVCGVNSCGAPVTSGAPLPDESDIYFLLAMFSVCGFIAVLLPLCFLDELPPSSLTVTNVKSWKTQLVATLKLMRDIKLVLLVPIMMFSGIEFAFLVGDFTKAYLTCTHDVSTVGLVMIGFGVSGVMSGPILGELVKKTGRIFLFSFGAIVQLSLLVYLYLWDPKLGQFWQLLLIAVGWGVADATWMIQTLSLIGVVFPTNQEPAFANCNLWQSVGFFITFLTSIPEAVCISHKIIGIGSWLILAMMMYFVCEFKIRRTDNILIIQNK